MTRTPNRLLLTLCLPLLLLAAACAMNPDAKAASPDTKDHHLPGEAKDEWITLFNGKDLTGWTPKFTGYDLGVNYNDTFRVVEEGVLTVNYDKWDEFGGHFGHLFYDTPFSSYIFQCEYRFVGEQVKGGPGWAWRNTGVMIHGQDPKTMTKNQQFPVSIEVQPLGGDGKNNRTTCNLCTPGTNVVYEGKLDKRHCINSASETFHGDQWVKLEIEVHGNGKIIHRVNGETVMEYETPQLDDRDADAKKLIEARGGDIMLTGGSISLQAESHPCEFRNIKIKVLKE